MIETQWVARNDEVVRRQTPGLADQLAAIERWAADDGTGAAAAATLRACEHSAL